MIIAPVVALLLMFSVNAGVAFDLSAKPIGDVVRWRTDIGNTSVEVLGQEGRYYKLAFTRDNSKGAPGFAIVWARSDGQIVEFIYSSGEWTKFAPHNCELTLGKCRYTERHSGGEKRRMIRVTTTAGGKYSYALYHTRVKPANLVEQGTFTVDQYGYMIDHDYAGADGKPRWSRRIGAADPSG